MSRSEAFTLHLGERVHFPTCDLYLKKHERYGTIVAIEDRGKDQNPLVTVRLDKMHHYYKHHMQIDSLWLHRVY